MGKFNNLGKTIPLPKIKITRRYTVKVWINVLNLKYADNASIWAVPAQRQSGRHVRQEND